MDDKLLNLLGLARRAGKITYGFDAVAKDVTLGKAVLVLLSCDIAEKTEQKTRRVCQEFGVQLIKTDRKMDEIGWAIGRADTAVSALIDPSFAKRAAELSRSAKREED